MSGTDLAYAATRLRVIRVVRRMANMYAPLFPYARPMPVLTQRVTLRMLSVSNYPSTFPPSRY
eukprot:2175972-Rhodomonas_salina.1